MTKTTKKAASAAKSTKAAAASTSAPIMKIGQRYTGSRAVRGGRIMSFTGKLAAISERTNGPWAVLEAAATDGKRNSPKIQKMFRIPQLTPPAAA